MQTVELKSQKRELKSKAHLRSIRIAGEVPVVVYGGKKASEIRTVNAKEFLRLLKDHGSNAIVALKAETGDETVLVKTFQRDILTRAPIHIDFQRISLTEMLEVSIPLHVKGEAPGVKLSGGILEHILRELRVRCLPTDIPAAVEVDVSQLQLNQGIKVKDLPLSKGVEVLVDPEHLVVNIVAPSELKEETPAAAVPGAAAEPEVIAKGKKPEEGAEGAAPAVGAKDAKAAPAPAAKEGAKEAKK